MQASHNTKANCEGDDDSQTSSVELELTMNKIKIPLWLILVQLQPTIKDPSKKSTHQLVILYNFKKKFLTPHQSFSDNPLKAVLIQNKKIICFINSKKWPAGRWYKLRLLKTDLSIGRTVKPQIYCDMHNLPQSPMSHSVTSLSVSQKNYPHFQISLIL